MEGVDQIINGEAQDILRQLPSGLVQAVIADPPYFRVLKSKWDRQWKTPADYVRWYSTWVPECMRVLKDDGLCFVFGQLGKREHVFLHVMSALAQQWAFHDLIIWDRVVGYNERRDSFTPSYEFVLVLRKSDVVKFRKGSVRSPYSPEKIRQYLQDGRYKDKAARRRHLLAGKYARNILAVPSLRGSSNEKVGHPSQKPVELIKKLVLVSTDPGDVVLDPFLGSGSTAAAATMLGRHFVGIERSKRYCKMAQKRLSAISGPNTSLQLEAA